MTKKIPPSELILNPDGSVYHLNLRPEQLASTVILVGDQGRVPRVSKHFDKIEHKISKREFVTHTGWLGEKRLSVVSTGIGTDNIDIVLTELDALVNIDLATRQVKPELTSLDLVRIGTSGSMSEAVGVDEMLISEMAIGLDNLLHYYPRQPSEREQDLAEKFSQFTEKQGIAIRPYAAESSPFLAKKIGEGMHRGITLTCPGFYGPQGRQLRLGSVLGNDFFENAGQFRFGNLSLTNFEMETSAIYGMAGMLGHRALSCNAIIAQRRTNEFSKDPGKVVNRLIVTVLGRI